MFSMKVEGGAQLSKAFAELMPSKERAVHTKMVMASAEPIRSRMEELTPVEPGKPDLKDNIIAAPLRTRGEIDDGQALRQREETEAIVAVGPRRGRQFYGGFLEFGTAKAPAQPFARPAFDEKVLEALRVYQQEIWAWLRKHSHGPSTTGRNL